MGFAVGGSGGLTLITTAATPALVYDPVVGTSAEFSGRLFYEVIPDIYHLLSDYDVLPEVWEGYMHLVADLLQVLVCAEGGDSIVDVPIDYQRKYVHLDLEFVDELKSDPELVYTGSGDERYVYRESSEVIGATWTTKLSTDHGYWPLQSILDQRASLRWSWRASYSQFEEGSYGFIGYSNSSSTAIEDSLLVGVGNGGRVGILHISETGDPNFVESPVVVPLDTLLDFEVTYDSATTIVAVTVTRVSDGTILLNAFSYSLIGGPSSELFSVDAFGFINLNSSQTSLDSHSAFVTVLSRAVVGEVHQVTYLDPSLGEDVQEVPYLQDTWKDPTFLWANTVDYEFVDGFLAFETQPPDYVLAEYISYNKELVKNNYGLSVGLSGDNTQLYKSQVQALHSIYWKGPTLRGIRLGIQVLLGLPFSEEAGEVLSINPVATGDTGEIVVRGVSGLLRSYSYPNTVSPVVTVGQEVEQFDYLTDGVEVMDWKTNPDWFKPFLDSSAKATAPDIYAEALNYLEQADVPVNELHKYHMFMISIDSSVFSIAQVSALQAFLESLKPTWKGYVLDVNVGLVDDVTIVDEIVVDMIVELWDHGGGSSVLAPRYGDPGWPPHDYQYEDPASIQYGLYHELFPDDPVEVRLDNISGSPQTILVGGVPVTVPAGDFVVENIP